MSRSPDEYDLIAIRNERGDSYSRVARKGHMVEWDNIFSGVSSAVCNNEIDGGVLGHGDIDIGGNS